MMLRFLLEKEFKQFRRNTFLPRLVIAFPLLVLLIFPLVASFEVKNIRLSIVDHDKSPASNRLVNKIRASDYFKISDVSARYIDALQGVEEDRSDVVIEIPAGFEKQLIREFETDVMISANAVNGNKGGLGTAYLISIVADYNESVLRDMAQLVDTPGPSQIEVVPSYRYNPGLRYEVYMVPALLVMVLSMVCGFLPSLNIVGEKEKGTLEQMNVTPVSRFILILSKLIPYWLIGYVVFTIGMGVALFVWDLAPEGSPGTLYIFASIFILAISGFGLVISNYASTVQQAMFMIFFFVLTFIFMSGLYTPIENMPPWAQSLSNFSPLKYMIQVLRMVYLKGSSIRELMPQMVALSAFALFFNGWAVYSYRKSE